MLTQEILKSTQELQGLTDAQLTAIETLSKNDENTVIGAKIGEIYGAIDNDLLQATGMQKNGTEKTYDYVKRVAGNLKEKSENVIGLNAKIEELTAKNQTLEKSIADNTADKELISKMNAATAELEQTKSQFNELKSKFDTQQSDFDGKLFALRVQTELNAATTGISFKKELPEALTSQTTKLVLDKLKSNYKHEFIDDGNGGERLIFLNEKGARLNNPENQLNPFTASELLKSELKAMGVLDEGRTQTGSGTKPQNGVNSDTTIDLSGCKTQTEALQAMRTMGIVNGSKEQIKAWKDYNIGKLPR